ncbi:MAG: ribonuclease H-like domain-containing protein [Eubacteriales bacterium]|nr:ribonuclease H-like domain-containing protein [Eubacteriales bacterium]
MPRLTDKLRMMDVAARAPAPSQPATPAPTDCYHASEHFALSSFSPLRHMNAPVLKQIFGFDFPPSVRPTDLLFLDSETTGLSGGAGTVAFEVGLGYLSGDHFVVEQLLMRDYPEEPLLLERVSGFTSAFPVLVTFNGLAFDAPLLQNRFIMNRMPGRLLPSLHADVLHASRRVWKLRLGSCTLQKLENAVLGVAREEDLPGSDVPKTYFRFLQNGDFGPIERILTHNRQDVVSLAQLFFFLCMLYDRPETAVEQDDLLSLARAMQKRGEAGKAKKCYRLAAHGHQRAVAFSELAAQEKREGNTRHAIKLYSAMLTRGEDTVFACESLAKIYEHQFSDPQQALAYTRLGLLTLSEPPLHGGEAVQSRRNALQYRYARLRRKISNAKPQEDTL